ncbi:hypothetical protein O6H91_Y132300 [Diphasiastrum complanatum]|nr:hypothetical protein O6H91_Y132300 [Diphasiastrum complanatum]
MAERMVYYGIAANFVTFLVYKFHHSFPDAVSMITNFMGTSCLTPLIGAVLADSYLGRYWTIAIFSIIYLIGLICLTISAAIPAMMPSDADCTQLELFLGVCQHASISQSAFLYFGLYVVALGSGGIRPCVAAFGADQFNEEDPIEKKNLAVFFNGFYFMISLGAILSLTGMVYIQNNVGWKWGLGALAIAMTVANITFFAGTPLYRHKLPSGSPLTRLAQVIVASVRKRKVKVPDDSSLLYEVYDKKSAIIGSRKLPHTRTLRFFDKAAVKTSSDIDESKPSPTDLSPWKLCTTTQVEELKALWRMLPIWAASIMPNTLFTQLLSFSVQQGLTMDRSMGKHFTIPAASVPVFAALFVVVLLPVYARLYVPLTRRLTGHPSGTTHLQRVGGGLLISGLSAVAAALVERRRRHLSYVEGVAFSPLGPVPMSAFWLVPQYALVGMAEVFAAIGQLEFFYEQAPDGMRSMGTSFFSTAAAAGSYFASLLLTIVKSATQTSEGQSTWLNDNINLGHIDYYYWLLALMSAVNLMIFVVVAHQYEYKQVEDFPPHDVNNKHSHKVSG